MNINLIAPINQLGYGTVGYNVAKELIQLAPVSFSLFPIGDKVDEVLLTPEIKNAISNSKLYDPNAPCVRIWHQHDLAQFVGRGAHVGYPIFELDAFTDLEKHQLNSCDGVFVCSEWAKQVCLSNHINSKVEVVPLGVDREIFKEREGYTGSEEGTVFLNCGKWEIRKGHDVLIEAWKRAFRPDDKVLLLMCNTNPFLTTQQSEYWRSLYKHPQIRLINRLQTSGDVARMMQMTDCGVFPSRAEGWNLEALEMLSCGKQLIITDYSAHTEFCSKDNTFMIDVNDVEPAKDGIWFHGQGNWARIGESQINQIAGYLRNVHDLKKKGNLGINKVGIETAKRFTWTNTAKSLIGGLDVITGAKST